MGQFSIDSCPMIGKVTLNLFTLVFLVSLTPSPKPSPAPKPNSFGPCIPGPWIRCNGYGLTMNQFQPALHLPAFYGGYEANNKGIPRKIVVECEGETYKCKKFAGTYTQPHLPWDVLGWPVFENPKWPGTLFHRGRNFWCFREKNREDLGERYCAWGIKNEFPPHSRNYRIPETGWKFLKNPNSHHKPELGMKVYSIF